MHSKYDKQRKTGRKSKVKHKQNLSNRIAVNHEKISVAAFLSASGKSSPPEKEAGWISGDTE